VALRRGELLQAQQHLEKLLQLQPDSAIARQMLARAYLARATRPMRSPP